MKKRNTLTVALATALLSAGLTLGANAQVTIVEKPDMGLQKEQVDKLKEQGEQVKPGIETAKDRLEKMSGEEKKAYQDKINSAKEKLEAKGKDKVDDAKEAINSASGTHTHADGKVHSNDAHAAHPDSPLKLKDLPAKQAAKAKSSMQTLSKASVAQREIEAKMTQLQAALDKGVATGAISRDVYDSKLTKLNEMRGQLKSLKERGASQMQGLQSVLN